MDEYNNGFHNEDVDNNENTGREVYGEGYEDNADSTPDYEAINGEILKDDSLSYEGDYEEIKDVEVRDVTPALYQERDFDNHNRNNFNDHVDFEEQDAGSHRYSYQEQGTGGSYYSNIPPEPDKKRRKKKGKRNSGGKGFAKLVASAAVFGIVAGACIVGVSVAKDKLYPSTAERVETTTATTSAKSGTSSSSSSSSGTTTQDVSPIVDAVMPSVVSITSTIQSSSYYGFGTQESEGAGSGFIIAKTKKKLMIATNNHVVSDATSLTVGFCDDTTATATLVGTDSSADLAVISVNLSDIKDATASEIKVATLGSSDDLKVGETVIAIGNALGYGQSVTTGVVSAKNREVSFTDGTMTLLQTDAAINPGNSGGVLVNMSGQVIGINNAKLEDTSVEGMGYAIPISTAKTVLDDLMNAESVDESNAAFLGIVGRDITETYSEALGIPTGIYVSQVVSGSPAEDAGISAGDIITKFEGNEVSTMSGLKEKIAVKKANTKVKITYKRANQSGTYEEKSTTVKLGKKSDFSDATSADSSSESESDSNSNSGNSGNSGNSNGNSGNSNGNSGNSGNSGTSPYEYFFGNGGSSDGSDSYNYSYPNY